MINTDEIYSYIIKPDFLNYVYLTSIQNNYENNSIIMIVKTLYNFPLTNFFDFLNELGFTTLNWDTSTEFFDFNTQRFYMFELLPQEQPTKDLNYYLTFFKKYFN